MAGHPLQTTPQHPTVQLNSPAFLLYSLAIHFRLDPLASGIVGAELDMELARETALALEGQNLLAAQQEILLVGRTVQVHGLDGLCQWCRSEERRVGKEWRCGGWR